MARLDVQEGTRGFPSYAELLRRVEEADDLGCDGVSEPSGRSCRRCEAIVKTLRGGSILCPTCGHINAVGHSCEDWGEYDAGRLTLAEVGARWNARKPVDG